MIANFESAKPVRGDVAFAPLSSGHMSSESSGGTSPLRSAAELAAGGGGPSDGNAPASTPKVRYLLAVWRVVGANHD